ncbi:4-sulfomuconolactone hydrolase [Stieleria neptunia]|uniref:4-sulfomuconolactone hydrolase n=1 Tax=Stieleria neptunia TaxID=2527979 RepID=A0A518HK68_9BACT|nr:amidohydrolase family protein [Stieleria neptunia]QDV41226.1 4-sulfomuconolactone hydrolase [Stieleria neptunia]
MSQFDLANTRQRDRATLRQSMGRREWIAGVAAAAGTVALPYHRVAAESSDDKGYIDAHVHVWTPDTKTYPLDHRYDVSAMQPPSFTPKQLLQLAEPLGVSRIVLIQMSFYGFDNSYMLDAIANHPGRFSGVAVIDPNDHPVETMKSLKAKGVRGFRIVSGKSDPDTWLSGEGMKKMWACAADESMAICPLINPEYLPSVDKMCQRYPETAVVIDHFARIGIDGSVHARDLDALCRLAEHRHTHVKTSAFYALGKKAAPYTDLGAMIHRLAHAYGSDRLMWATDCPYQVQAGHTYHDSLDLIRFKLDFLTERDRSWMLRKTAEKVFFA